MGQARSTKRHSERGYTLIEVSAAMVFVATIIVLLSAVTISIVRSYNRGIWLSQINQAGQQLNADIGDKARYSTAATVDVANRRLCVGGISYLWNTKGDIDGNRLGNNVFSDAPGTVFSLIRVEDPNAAYCSDSSLKPAKRDTTVHTLLGRGAVIQEFDVKQGVGGDSNIPLLSISTVISTDGDNQPVRSYTASDGSVRIDVDGANGNSHWQCGQWYDNNNNGRVDNDDRFEPSQNQYCSFAQYDITVYERSRQK